MQDNPYSAPNDPETPRDTEERRGGLSLKSAAITLARATSYAAALLAIGGIATLRINPNRSSAIIGGELWGLSGPVALIGFLLCCVAATINSRQELERRPLLLAMVCIGIAFCVGLFSPVTR